MSATAAEFHDRIARPRVAVARLAALLVDLDSRYRARVRLAAIEDRMLADIGVSRADIDAELRRPLI